MGGSFQQWGNHSLLCLLTVSWNCPGTSGCVIQLADWGSGFSWIWLVILDSFDFNQFIYALGLCHFFQKLCPAPFPPVSCSFPEPRLVPQLCLYNLLEGQPENSWPLGGKYCIISNPSRYSGLHQISTPLSWNIWSDQFVLKPLTNYQDPGPLQATLLNLTYY